MCRKYRYLFLQLSLYLSALHSNKIPVPGSVVDPNPKVLAGSESQKNVLTVLQIPVLL
jgi:hypothetical protein